MALAAAKIAAADPPKAQADRPRGTQGSAEPERKAHKDWLLALEGVTHAPVDVGLQATLAGLNASVLLALLVPTATVLAIKLLSGPDAPLLNQGVLTFPTLAAIAALTLSLIVHSLCAAHPPLESGTNAGSEQAALDDLEADAHLLTMNQTQRALRDSPMARMIETLGELGNDAVAPTAGLQAQSIAIVCLMLSPFFS